MWFMEYVPCFFRFIIAGCVLYKVYTDVYRYNQNHQPGVLKHRKDENWQYKSPELYADYHYDFTPNIQLNDEICDFLKMKTN